jgi:hypothetical protein
MINLKEEAYKQIEIKEDTFDQLEEFRSYCKKRWNKSNYSDDTIISVALDRELERLQQTWREENETCS